MPALRPIGSVPLILLALFAGPTLASDVPPRLTRAYEVNRKVGAFSGAEDLSTPEAAYASINRLIAAGDEGAWRR